MRVIGIIPARYASTRLPGKPLMDICGKPMLQYVYDRVFDLNELDNVYVATDDERIRRYCENTKIPVIMTDSSHKTAANRLWEVSEQINADLYIQINGDEPLINRDAICAVASVDLSVEEACGVNVVTKISDPAQLFDPSNIKVVFDMDWNAIYMSRTPIPYPFRSIDFKYYKHVGIIGYNKKMLDFYHGSVPGKLEMIEGIDTLRFLDYGKKLKFIPIEGCESLSVDTEKDLEIVRRIIEG